MDGASMRTEGWCLMCGEPYRPTHDTDAPGVTVRHRYVATLDPKRMVESDLTHAPLDAMDRPVPSARGWVRPREGGYTAATPRPPSPSGPRLVPPRPPAGAGGVSLPKRRG